MTSILASVHDEIVNLSEELAKWLKYSNYTEGPVTGFASAVGRYAPENPDPKDPRCIVMLPRGVRVYGWTGEVSFFVDSTYEIWYAYGTGDIKGLTAAMDGLFMLEYDESPWPKLLQVWYDLKKSKHLPNGSWMLAGQNTPTTSIDPSPTAESSPSTDSRKVPTFGDLASGRKRITTSRPATERWSQ